MIIFRCNAGPTIGFGHLVRCRALATTLKAYGEYCVMVGPSKKYETPEDSKIFTAWVPRPSWESATADVNVFLQLAMRYSARMAVLDDYRIDEAYQLALRAAGMHWMQFDGSAHQPLWADLVLNASPDVKAEDYDSVLCNHKTHLLLGPKYAILRPEFVTPVKRQLRSGEYFRVLITFGGGDDRGAILFVLDALYDFVPDAILDIVSGAENPRIPEIERWVSQRGNLRVTLNVNPQPVRPIFANCDLAVMGGGTTTFEVASCGVPMILLTIAENQVHQAQGWEERGAAIYLGAYGEVQEKQLIKSLNMLRLDVARMDRMSENGTIAVDGCGAMRVAEELITNA